MFKLILTYYLCAGLGVYLYMCCFFHKEKEFRDSSILMHIWRVFITVLLWWWALPLMIKWQLSPEEEEVSIARMVAEEVFRTGENVLVRVSEDGKITREKI